MTTTKYFAKTISVPSTYTTDLVGKCLELNGTVVTVTGTAGTNKYYIDNFLSNEILTDQTANVYNANAAGKSSHIEGRNCIALGNYSHAEGEMTKTTNERAHAEGYYTEASGADSHAEGDHSKATGDQSHAEGFYTEASASNSHAEGFHTIANSRSLNVIGEYNDTIYSDDYSTRETILTNESFPSTNTYYLITGEPEFDYDSGYYIFDSSVVTTLDTIKIGDKIASSRDISFSTKAEAYYEITKINGSDNNGYIFDAVKYERVHLRYDKGKYVHIVGNGTDDQNRSNAHTLDWDGNAWYQGNVYVGGTDQDNGSEKLMTQSEVTALINEVLAAILPTPTADDVGKMLTVNAEGKYELVAAISDAEIAEICN